MAASLTRLGLIIRQGPGRDRSGRGQLDLAVAAAAMGVELELIFLGPGLVHLRAGSRPAEADMGALAERWKSLAELTRVRFHTTVDDYRRQDSSAGWSVPVEARTHQELQEIQDSCDRLLTP